MTHDKEKIKKYIALLPDEIRSIYENPSTMAAIEDICNQYGVKHFDLIGIIVDAVYDLILGLLKPTDFVSTITNETGIGQDTANLITHDINEQLLRPIRNQLMTYHQSLEHDDLPKNTEKDDLGVSSTPYPETKTNNREQEAILDEIENPSPATVVTRDIFQEKKANISVSTKTAEKIDISTSKPVITEVKKKSDPYREPIA